MYLAVVGERSPELRLVADRLGFARPVNEVYDSYMTVALDDVVHVLAESELVPVDNTLIAAAECVSRARHVLGRDYRPSRAASTREHGRMSTRRRSASRAATKVRDTPIFVDAADYEPRADAPPTSAYQNPMTVELRDEEKDRGGTELLLIDGLPKLTHN